MMNESLIETFEAKKKFDKEFKKLKPLMVKRDMDAIRCRRSWDDIDRWASGEEMFGTENDWEHYYRFQSFEDPNIDPFTRSKYLKRNGIPR